MNVQLGCMRARSIVAFAKGTKQKKLQKEQSVLTVVQVVVKTNIANDVTLNSNKVATSHV